MSRRLPLPPPGFDDLPIDDKVEYVQSLWDLIAKNDQQVPVPEWHKEVLRQRLRDRQAHPDKALEWREVHTELQRELQERKPDQ